jgi:hypothetical protein
MYVKINKEDEKMLGIEYFKAEPTEYARITVNGRVRREGTGISGLIIPALTSVELVSTATCE